MTDQEPGTPPRLGNMATASHDIEKSDNASDHAPVEAPPEHDYPSGLKLVVLMTSVFIGMFLIALDKLIISTATPAITNEFHASSDVGWYGTAYLLTNAATILIFGKLYTFCNIKWTFICTVLLFEVGSAICGAAPNSIAFIIGRAIAGLGAGGVQEGVLVIIVYAVPLAKRPMYQGLFGAVYGISSVIGPLVGGAFTSNVTWRWCFYINLPLGAVVLLAVFFLLHIPDGQAVKGTWLQHLEQLNLPGMIALIPGVICLCLALQWGGFTYQWNDGLIIALLTFGLFLLVAFMWIQFGMPKSALVPPHIFVQRSIFTGFWVSAMLGAHQTIFIYFLPIWFQAVKGVSAVRSGIDTLPYVIAMVVSSILCGVGTSKAGYYTPFLIIGTVIAAIGAGLFILLEPSTSVGAWIGYQVVYGFGLGACFQAPNMAAQTVLSKKEASIGVSLVLFAQTLFGAIFVSVGQNVLDQELVKRIAGLAGTTISAAQIEAAGITGFFDMVPDQLQGAAVAAYNFALRKTYIVGVIMASLAVLGGLGMEWRNVKVEGAKQEKAEADEREASRAATDREKLAASSEHLSNDGHAAEDVKSLSSDEGKDARTHSGPN